MHRRHIVLAGIVSFLLAVLLWQLTPEQRVARYISAHREDLEARAEVRTGSYVGDGAASKTISLGFTPKAVLVESIDGVRTAGGMAYGGLALPDLPVNLTRPSAEIVSGGFKVYQNSYAGLNYSGAYYCYLAFK